MLIILAGIIAYIGTVALELVLVCSINLSISSFSFIVIPVSAIAIAYALGTFIAWSCHRSRVRHTKLVLVVALFVGILIYPSIRYGEYRVIRYAEEMSTNHYGNFVAKDHTFWEYEQKAIESEQLRMGKRGMVTLDTPYTYNLIMHILRMLAYMITLPLVAYTQIKSARYCEKCRYFYRKHALKAFDAKAKPSPEDYHKEQWLQQNMAYTRMPDSYYIAHLEYCPHCQEGVLTLQYNERIANKFEHIERKDRTLSITDGNDIWRAYKVAKKNNFTVPPKGYHNLFWLWFFLLPLFPLGLIGMFFDKQAARLLTGTLTLNGILYFICATFLLSFCIYCSYALMHHLLYRTGWKFRFPPRLFCAITSVMIAAVFMGVGALLILYLHGNGVF